MIYPENFEEKINFTHVREWLKERCLSPLGLMRADAMAMMNDFDAIDRSTGLTEEFRQICLMESGFPERDFYDVTTMLRHIAVPGAFPEREDVFALKKALETIRDILRFLHAREQYPLLRSLTADVATFADVIKAIDRILDHNGAVRDNASTALADIRREMASKQTAVARAMQRIIKQAQAEGLVEEGVTPSVRDGHTVIPVNASFKRRINGIVHDESATGRTSFIEPAEVVAANNAIRELQFAEQREIIRIMTAFADFLRPMIEEMLAAFDFLGEIDFIRAKALLALRMKAVKPAFRNQQAFEWLKARHPVMYVNFARDGREIVPLDVRLTAEQRILLISGPNAGGKSVCLKTVGLIQYMFQCGLLVPLSENSEIGLFDRICIDIGDEQSIDNDLSTYSSHLLNMKSFLRWASTRTLILIDEFGAGTEPTLGGAIAEAILDSLAHKGVWGVVTTHYTNLKHYASTNDGIVNGAMLYDSQKMQPLFRLEMGKPGSSFAFEIARKIGLPEDILAVATDKAGRQLVDFEKHLREIERDKRYWERKREDVRKHEKKLDEISEKQLTELEKIELERKKIIEQAKIEAQQILADANRAIEQTIRTIKESQAEKERTRTARRELEAFKEKAQQAEADNEDRISRKIAQLKERERRKAARKAENTEQTSVTAADAVAEPTDLVIRAGDAVKMTDGDIIGEVIEVNGKNATVAFGHLLSTLAVGRLIKISKNELRKNITRRTTTTSAPSFNGSERRLNFKSSIDVRGYRTDEALPKVEELINDASMLDVGEVRILHGKGNGILRQMIRQLLATIPAVASFADEDLRQGGTGITVVKVS